MDKKTVTEMLQDAGKNDLIDIIAKMSASSHKAEKIIIDWCKNSNPKYQKKAIEMELEGLWQQARTIISEFNAYGGGPEFQEEEACDNLWKMDEIVQEHDISWESRGSILDEMLEEFNIGNSGFDDILIDVASSFCKSREEKIYFADALAKGNNSYYRDYAAHIYQELGDDEQFLQLKIANLRYGSDYVEIAKYYEKAGNRKKQLEYIWTGLEKSTGRLDELIDYAAQIYRKEKNEAELKHLYEFARKTGADINIAAIAGQIYKYSEKKGDYGSQKKMLLVLLDTCEKSVAKKWFKLCKSKFHPEDWEEEYENILEKIRKKDTKFYLDICMETGREDVVLKYFQDARGRTNGKYS